MTAKRVLLTGASTGIGNATLQRLVADGHHVTTLDIKDEPEGSSRHLSCDLSDPASIDAVVDQLDGPFDALGNIAGVAGSMGAELVLRVNVYGLRHLTERLLATGAIAPGGSIVNVASLAGMAWQRHLERIATLDAAADFVAGIEVARAYEGGGPAAYVLSKEWVVAYTQRLAGRLLPQRIRVNSVSPGPVLTPLYPYFETDAGPEQMAWLNEQVGRAGRAGRPGRRHRVARRRRQRLGERRRPPRRRRTVSRHADRLGRHQDVAGVAGPPPAGLTSASGPRRPALGHVATHHLRWPRVEELSAIADHADDEMHRSGEPSPSGMSSFGTDIRCGGLVRRVNTVGEGCGATHAPLSASPPGCAWARPDCPAVRVTTWTFCTSQRADSPTRRGHRSPGTSQ